MPRMKQRGNPIAVGLVVIGAVLMVVSAFLPLHESIGMFRFIEENTLIQHNGWILVAAAVALAASGLGAAYGDSVDWALPFIISVLIALGIVFWATNKDLRTLYPVGNDGTVDATQPGIVAANGIAIYVAGLGVALALVGSWMLPRRAAASAGGTLKRKCPDCAETILADAKVCKHCGNRLAAPAPTTPPVAAPAAEVAVTCPFCGAALYIPATAKSYRCATCRQVSETPLGRAASPALAPVDALVTKVAVTCPLCHAEQHIPAGAAQFKCGRCKEVSNVPA